MTTESKTAVKQSPVFGILSVLVPIIGIVCLLTVQDHAGTMDYLPNAHKRMNIFTVTPMVGIVFAVGAWKRREGCLALRCIGLFLDLLMFLPVMFVFMFNHSSSHF